MSSKYNTVTTVIQQISNVRRREVLHLMGLYTSKRLQVWYETLGLFSERCSPLRFTVLPVVYSSLPK